MKHVVQPYLPHVTPRVPRSIHAKFHADWSKTVGVRGIHTETHTHMDRQFFYYVYPIYTICSVLSTSSYIDILHDDDEDEVLLVPPFIRSMTRSQRGLQYIPQSC